MQNGKVKKLVLSSIFLAFAIILQLIGANFVQINPLLIGPLINTVILLTTYVCGLTYGILIGILIPALAVPLGALAPLLVPFAPFIVVGNILYSVSFALLMNRGKFGLYLAVVLSSLVRFLVFSISATKLIYLFGLNLPEKSASLIGASFTTPQLIIALLGGAVAIVVIKLLEKYKLIHADR